MDYGYIRRCTIEHLSRYGEIYAAAFSGEPWNNAWTVEDATKHVREILSAPTSYGLEYVTDDGVVGIILGSSMLFHYGRTFEINDLAVAPEYQKSGIGRALLERMLSDLRDSDIKAVHLITAADGALPEFYERLGFKKEE